MQFKKPRNTMWLIIIMLLIFSILCGAFIYTQIVKLIQPLNEKQRQENETIVVDSTYAEFDIIEENNTHTIYRDTQTDVLYIEFKRNGYSSAMSVLMNADGTPKTYSQYIGG